MSVNLKKVTWRRLELALRACQDALGARTPFQRTALVELVHETIRILDLDADEPSGPLPPSQSGIYPAGFEPPPSGPWEFEETPIPGSFPKKKTCA